jgi:glycosyltransferase involved in cell wall biosynthesis
MRRNSGGRVVFDVSTSMRWMGPPVGIVRVERMLALWAHANVPGVVFAFFDPNRLAYCEVITDVHQFLTGEAALDTLELTNPALPRKRRTDHVPAALQPLFLWISQTRRTALNRLEGVRLRTRRPWFAHLADRLQRWLMSAKYRRFMVKSDDTRRSFIPHKMAVGARINFDHDDTLVCVGFGWRHSNIGALNDLKSRIGFRMVLMCHDLIPLLFPHFYPDHDVQLFGDYMHKALAIADRIVVNSRRVETDCRDYCMRHDIVPGDIVVASLGFDAGSAASESLTKLPAELRAGQFAMLVSTIEPRKGHRLLCRVWKRLLAEHVPQATGFKLIFAGRAGWMVDDLLEEIRSDPDIAGQILTIHDVDDDLLAALYQGAAFCVYPSLYEGYGLPIIEAFAHGKAVIASNGGAIPELVQGFSPCLDPTDEDAWYEIIKQWIKLPQLRVGYEREICARFRYPTWSVAAADFFAGISKAKHR